jgi:uncharacterized membrane protein YhiD involved in acid resistance
VGLGVGLGNYALVLAATAVTLVSLVAMRVPEKWIQRKLALDRQTLTIHLASGAEASPLIVALAEIDGLRIRELRVQRDDEQAVAVEALVVAERGVDVAQRTARLAEREDVAEIEVT